jgi:hypothetical protein
MSDAAPLTPGWPDRGPLYRLLFAKFPGYRTPQGILDVYGLAADLILPGRTKGMTGAGLYKWINNGSLTTAGAAALIATCTNEDNRGALEQNGEAPITREDLLPFLFA